MEVGATHTSKRLCLFWCQEGRGRVGLCACTICFASSHFLVPKCFLPPLPPCTAWILSCHPPHQFDPGLTLVPQVTPLLDCHAGAITGVAPHPCQTQLLVTVGLDGVLRTWEAAQGQLVGHQELGGPLTCLALGPGKGFLAVGSRNGVLR
jgi:WD40 repeat protein